MRASPYGSAVGQIPLACCRAGEGIIPTSLFTTARPNVLISLLLSLCLCPSLYPLWPCWRWCCCPSVPTERAHPHTQLYGATEGDRFLNCSRRSLQACCSAAGPTTADCLLCHCLHWPLGWGTHGTGRNHVEVFRTRFSFSAFWQVALRHCHANQQCAQWHGNQAPGPGDFLPGRPAWVPVPP